MPLAATCMQFKIILLSEVNHKEKFKHNMVLPVESKLRHKRTDLRNRHRTTDAENRLVVAKGRRWGREAEVHRRELLYREWISNKVLLYSMESCLQHSVKTIMEKMIFSKRTHTHTHTHTHIYTHTHI